MAGKCAAITQEGVPCRGLVRAGNDHCPAHDPARQEARRKAASKAGKSKPGHEVSSVKAQLQDLADRVVAGTIDRADASVVGQLLNIKLRALETERKIRETEELEARVAELERNRSNGRFGGRWGS